MAYVLKMPSDVQVRLYKNNPPQPMALPIRPNGSAKATERSASRTASVSGLAANLGGNVFLEGLMAFPATAQYDNLSSRQHIRVKPPFMTNAS